MRLARRPYTILAQASFRFEKSMIGEILSTLSVAEKLGKFFSWVRKKRTRSAETVSSRFIRLFELHDVHRNQIPRFFGHGLTLSDVHDEASLLKKLDEAMLEAASSLFGVCTEWLEGAASEAYTCHDFYKRPADVAPFLAALKVNNPDGDLFATLLVTEEKKDAAVIVLCETIGAIRAKPIYRYHFCGNWRFDYWKSRAYLVACVAIFWKHDICVRGRYASSELVECISNGEFLPSGKQGDLACPTGKMWYPEDMALSPADFLSGIDPKRDNAGIVFALALWLKLEEQGYMSTGLPMYRQPDIRESFEHALASHSQPEHA